MPGLSRYYVYINQEKGKPSPMPTPVFILQATTLENDSLMDPRFDANIILTPALNPILVKKIIKAGATRTGAFSFVVGKGNADNNYQCDIRAVLEAIGDLTYDRVKMKQTCALIKSKPFSIVTTNKKLCSYARWNSDNNLYGIKLLQQIYRPTEIVDLNLRTILSVTSSATTYYLRFYTNWSNYRTVGPNGQLEPTYFVGRPTDFISESPVYLGNADIFLPKHPIRAITLGEVIQILHNHSEDDIPDLTLLDDTKNHLIKQFLDNPEEAFLIWENRKSYGNPHIYLGNSPIDITGPVADKLRSKMVTTHPSSTGSFGTISLGSLKNLPANNCDPQVQDLINMLTAHPIQDPALREFQQKAVARHLATRYGYVNLCATGSGKSVMAASAMAYRGRNNQRYRGLVITEASVRNQFANEIAKWFPSAKVVSVCGTKDLQLLKEALKEKCPVVGIVSYTLLGNLIGNGQRTSILDTINITINENEESTEEVQPIPDIQKKNTRPRLSLAEKLFLGTTWNDLVADEADVLRNSSSNQSKALWQIRQNAEIAVAMTATPITKTADDLGKIIAWARNAPIASGQSLTKRYDFTNDKDTLRFGEDYEAVLFRYDKTAFQDDLPIVKPPTLCVLEPTKEEVALSHAARQGLKNVYFELLAKIEEVADLNPTSDMYAQAKEELRAARGAWLGGTQLARLAASDPSALLASNSLGAKILQLDNWVQPAIDNGSTKRKWVINTIIDRVSSGGRVLLFSEFSSVARMLVRDLQASGLRVGLVEGGGGKARDKTVVSYQNGLLDVLVSTSAGQKGLNLQNTTTVIHYDLPWTPLGLIQRNGRVERIGSSVKDVETIYVSLRGTIEEKIVSLVVSRAMEQAQILDTSRGTAPSESEFGRLAMSLGVSASTMELDTRQTHLLELTRAIIEESQPHLEQIA
jgi:superfamily II DNA or RNA helicase